MKRTLIIYGIIAVLCLPFLASCLITTLDTTWKDPDYKGSHLDNILVIGATKNQTIRRVVEDDFVAKLMAHGAEASSSYKIIPTEDMLDRDVLESKIKTLNVDAVLITRVVERKKEKEVYASGNRPYNWYGWYSRSYSYSSSSLYKKEHEVLQIETSIFDTNTGEMIWSALSDTIKGGSVEVEIKSLTRVIMKSLLDSGLI